MLCRSSASRWAFRPEIVPIIRSDDVIALLSGNAAALKIPGTHVHDAIHKGMPMLRSNDRQNSISTATFAGGRVGAVGAGVCNPSLNCIARTQYLGNCFSGVKPGIFHNFIFVRQMIELASCQV